MAAKKPTKKTTSTGSPTLDAANAAKKFKAPKDYKPMTTAQKVAMAASLVGPGKVVKGIKAASKLTKTGKAITERVKANKVDAAQHYGYEWMNHPGAASMKSNARLNKGKWSSPKQIAKYQRQEAKTEIKAEARALKAANKPTKASKTFEGNNKKISVEVRRGVLKNTPPARPNRERGGSLKTLRRQGKTGK